MRPLVRGALPALLLARLATSTGAAAATASAGAAFAELPQGVVTSPGVVTPPAAIAGSEEIEGWTVRSERPANQPRVAFVEGEGSCFTITSVNDPTWAEEAKAPDWAGNLTAAVNVNASQVVLVHGERLIPGGKGLLLESRDAWVDARTHGARLITVATLPLLTLGEVPGNVRLLAGRERGRAQVVLVGDRDLSGGSAPLEGTDSRGGRLSTECAFVRVALDAERGDADSATLFGDASIPSDESVRILRRFRVHASVSWLSRDPGPVLAWTFGWAGLARENPQPQAPPHRLREPPREMRGE